MFHSWNSPSYHVVNATAILRRNTGRIQFRTCKVYLIETVATTRVSSDRTLLSSFTAMLPDFSCNVGDILVSIAAFQAVDLGLIPGKPKFFGCKHAKAERNDFF